MYSYKKNLTKKLKIQLNGAAESPAPDKAHARDKAQDKSQQMDKDQIQNNQQEEEEAHVQEITNSM